MERKRSVGFRVRTLSVAIKRAFEASKSRSGFECTGTHGWVIGYLYDNRDRDVFQRDIEKQFSVRRPTMTEILKLMEKNGLVVREKCESDARLKRIRLTEKALLIHERHEKHIQSFENALREGISDEEMAIWLSVSQKIEQNAANAEKMHTLTPEEEKND
ncbi:MAG: MarR family transcriptional regulator [Clostridia bacterium]|nr:MarR family transcriptional regulator [Clostridia bacterium]